MAASPATGKPSVFPPLHKKRLYQGVAAYAALMVAVGCWAFLSHDSARKAWEDSIPHATAEVRALYLTPQLTDVSRVTPADFGVVDAAAVAGSGNLALIMSDIGLSQAADERALQELPPAVTLALSPYGAKLQDVLKEAKADNRETLLLLPMEPASYPAEDPGPKALMTRGATDVNLKSLDGLLASAEGVSGVMNYMGSAFLANERSLQPVVDALAKRQLTLVETPGMLHSVAGRTAQAHSASFIGADITIDEKPVEADIRRQLAELEHQARTKGYAVGIAHPYPITFNLLRDWIAGLEERGITLVPLSGALQLKNNPPAPAPLPAAPAVSSAPPAAPASPLTIDNAGTEPPPLP